MNKKAEEIRIRYLYRNLILRKKIRFSLPAAQKLVGPDCAYHLYSLMGSRAEDESGAIRSKDKT